MRAYQKISLRPRLLVAGLLFLLSACVLREQGLSSRAGKDEALGSPGHLLKQGKGTAEVASSLTVAPTRSLPASIFALDGQTFKFLLRQDQVWDAALNVLMRNYNLTIVDRSSGIVTTEWDSFYLDGSVYRNKLSLRIYPLSYRSCQLTIVNNVEVLRDGSSAGAGAIGAIWLPSDDTAKESQRVIRNIAAILDQPAPIFPSNMVKNSKK